MSSSWSNRYVTSIRERSSGLRLTRSYYTGSTSGISRGISEPFSEPNPRSQQASPHSYPRSIDDGVGRILDWLDQEDLARDTMIIYTSDQGFFLGYVYMT